MDKHERNNVGISQLLSAAADLFELVQVETIIVCDVVLSQQIAHLVSRQFNPDQLQRISQLVDADLAISILINLRHNKNISMLY